MSTDDDGVAAIAGLVLIGVSLIIVLAMFSGAQLLLARTQAANAADAAALAAAPVTFRPFGATGGPAAEASHFAAANGATLIRCLCASDPSFAARVVEVEVKVRVGLPVLGSREVRATGRAEFKPAQLLSSG